MKIRRQTEESLKTREETKFQISIHGFSVQAGNCITISKTKPICETHVRNEICESKWRISSSEKEHKENALALGADEGRDKLR